MNQDYEKRYIETSNWMLFYPDYKRECEMFNLEDERENIIFSNLNLLLYQSRKGKAKNIADPTASKALRLAYCNREIKLKWIRLCEDAEGCLSPKLKVFLKLRREYRYISSKKGWTAKLQANFPYEVAKFLNIEVSEVEDEVWIQNRKTFHDWWGKIVRMTMHGAARRGLFEGEV